MKGDFPAPSLPRGGCRQRVPRWEVRCSHQLARNEKAMTILYAGIDLAKNVFALHGVAAGGAVVLEQPRVARAKLHEPVATLPPCTLGIEACSGAHHWARLFARLRQHRHRRPARRRPPPGRAGATVRRAHQGEDQGLHARAAADATQGRGADHRHRESAPLGRTTKESRR